MPALIAFNEYMRKPARQYIVRNVPDHIDRALRRKAKESSKSFNQVALEALAASAGEKIKPKRDFSEVIGSLTEGEAERLEEEVRLQRQIDPKI